MLKRPKCGLIHNMNRCLIYSYDEVTSTNDFLIEAGKQGAKMGTVVEAKRQTAGKGSKGRSFYSPKNGAYFSLLIRPGAKLNASMFEEEDPTPLCPSLTPEQCALITPAVACAVAQGIESYTGKRMEIKWVNDIYYKKKKVAGILVESALDENMDRFYVIGVGINLFPSEDGFPEEFAENATTVFKTAPESLMDKVDGTIIRNRILENINAELYQLSKKGFLPEYRKRSCVLGYTVVVTPLDGSEPYLAEAVEIDDNARLVVKTASGELKTLNSEDVQLSLKENLAGTKALEVDLTDRMKNED